MVDSIDRPPIAGSEHVIGGAPAARVSAEIGALSHRGLVRETNEDAFLVFRLGRFLECVSSNLPAADLPPRSESAGHALVLADGVGGHQAGEVASRTALAKTLEFVLRSPRWVLKLDDPDTREAELKEIRQRSGALLATLQAAVRDRAASDRDLAGMGTTITAAYAVGQDLFVLHVGDSRAYRVRAGALRRITRDHTMAQEFADMGVIQPGEIPTHRLHHVLTRAVGGPDDALEGDFHHLRIEHGDRVLLCSDGLSDLVSDDEIAATLAAHPRSQEACQALIDLALERGGRDNVTVMVAAFSVASDRA